MGEKGEEKEKGPSKQTLQEYSVGPIFQRIVSNVISHKLLSDSLN